VCNVELLSQLELYNIRYLHRLSVRISLFSSSSPRDRDVAIETPDAAEWQLTKRAGRVPVRKYRYNSLDLIDL